MNPLMLSMCSNCNKNIVKNEITVDTKFENDLIKHYNSETNELESLECPYCGYIYEPV